MKPVFDTVCVWIGSMLHGRPMRWSEARDHAAVMRAACDAYTGEQPDVVDGEGEKVNVEPPASPFNYLCDGLLNVLAVAVGIFLVYKIVAAFLHILPILLLVGVVVWIGYMLTRKPIVA